MNTKELIEKQIEEAADHLARSAASIQDDELSSSLVFLGEACARLLQIVQNQQSQIEHLSERCDILRQRMDSNDSRHNATVEEIERLKR